MSLADCLVALGFALQRTNAVPRPGLSMTSDDECLAKQLLKALDMGA